MNRIFTICVALIATLYLLVAAFPLLAEAQNRTLTNPQVANTPPPPDAKDVAPNHTIVLPSVPSRIMGDENAAIVEHAPIVRLWLDILDVRPEPTLFFALWRDGTIIWLRSDDGRNLWRNGRNPEYFQSKISEKQVEDFLSAFDKVGLLEHSGTRLIHQALLGLRPPTNYFFLETENVQCRVSLTVTSIFWPDGDANPVLQRPEMRQKADRWRSVVGLLLELIPEKGEQISLSIERKNVDERQWVWAITPVPLRDMPIFPSRPGNRLRVEENVRDTGVVPLEQPIFPPRNTVVPPVRPR